MHMHRYFLLAGLLALGSIRLESAPIEESFGLGPVKVTIGLEPEEPVIGDTLTLSIRVEAEKDVELLMPEFGEALDRFTIIDFVPRQELDREGRTIATQVYRLQPPTSGTQAIPPILIEFVDRRAGQRSAPEGEDAYEILTDRMEFQVRSVIPEDADAEMKPPLGELPPLGPASARKWPWLLGLVLLCGAATPFVVRWYRESRRWARRRSAYEIARGRLRRLLASSQLAGEHVDAFYVELSGIVRRYVEDRFELRAPELTTEEFLNSVGQSPDFSRDHQQLLREFLRQADLVKFAGVRPAEDDIQRSIDSARRFIEETRENAPLIEVDEDSEQGDSSEELTASEAARAPVAGRQ